MSEIAVMLTILAITIVIFVWNKIPVEIVAIGVALLLFATGIIGIDDAFSGFGSQTVILIAALFVVAESIDAAGITTWMGGLLVRFAGDSRPRLIALIMLFTAFLTAIISVNGAVAALLPMVVVLAVRLGREPGQLLMPMAFAAHAGSLLVLTGSPVNILILEAAIGTTGRGIGFFEFALVGLPLLAGTIAVAIYLGPRLLPQRVPEDSPKDLSDHPLVLLGHYWPAEHELARLLVPAGSLHIGSEIAGMLPASRGGRAPAQCAKCRRETPAGRHFGGRQLPGGARPGKRHCRPLPPTTGWRWKPPMGVTLPADWSASHSVLPKSWWRRAQI